MYLGKSCLQIRAHACSIYVHARACMCMHTCTCNMHTHIHRICIHVNVYTSEGMYIHVYVFIYLCICRHMTLKNNVSRWPLAAARGRRQAPQRRRGARDAVPPGCAPAVTLFSRKDVYVNGLRRAYTYLYIHIYGHPPAQDPHLRCVFCFLV